jgi:pimeloyl-ACP methyl ester carboxylesterase
MPSTIILVHGAFADSSSWDGVIDPVLEAGHPVIAAANPLRSLATDAASVGDLVRTVEGPVVLVAHSYGGAVISNVPADAGEITGLVYVNGFAPDAGEHCFQRASAVEGRAVMVPDRRGGPHHPRRATALHGRARRRAATARSPGRVACGRRLAAQADG